MIITNIGRLVTMRSCKKGNLFEVIEDASVVINSGKIKWFGKTSDLNNYATGDLMIDAKGFVVIPGLIDCHTHLVHGGDRVNEFAMRARGAKYEEIAKAGGGIMSTVRATREANEYQLFELARSRAEEAIRNGTTTIEVKSGYGLDLETELKILRVVKRLNQNLAIDFIPTFLGAHSFPLKTANVKDRKEYVNFLVKKMIPLVAEEKLAEFCDIFIEKVAFTKAEAEIILRAAKKAKLKIKVHADQLSKNGGSLVAAKFKAVSADHLENITSAGVSALRKSKTVAVMIPSSTYFVGGKYAPARNLIKKGIPVAISTDYNPGTSPVLSLWLAASMAITQMKLTPEEAYKGITINAAKAVGRESSCGTIEIGKDADLLVLSAKNEFEPFYRFDKNFVSKVIKKGKVIYETD